ncbi:tonB-system energizer ExbB [Hyphomicrobium sp. NDB2Meth4]|uniref:tonB-system energizer ExbB n=1 Tax=Hyphomicrobium sp. NDB2Meth4 TaxID=1892846 RepID=UPI001FCDCD3B|nr:tonB-system energizer ExbB [Hyphomicrobium sp. NDB2Meth4]
MTPEPITATPVASETTAPATSAPQMASPPADSTTAQQPSAPSQMSASPEVPAAPALDAAPSAHGEATSDPTTAATHDLSQTADPAGGAAMMNAPATPGAAPSTEAGPATVGHVNAEKLPRDLSPWGMFMQADIIVKAVMIGLLLASVVTWTVWLAKTIELFFAKRRLRSHLRKLAAANSLAEAAQLVDSKRGVVPSMISAAVAETRASWDVADKYAIKERIEARLDRVELAAGRDINRGTGVLATIGSTAPFVGLFGTVWGIMNSFIGISEAQTTNLAIVAPGIAEALLATAFGLVAAIPAVIVYNHFARAISGYKALAGDASVAVLGLVSRDFDRGVRAELRAAE